MKDGIKHLIECNCILVQFLEVKNPPFHKFIVFSVINEDGSLEPSLIQCNNCGVLHKVIEVNKSKILPKEESALVPKISEIKEGLPKELVDILTSYKCEIYVWQEAKFYLEQQIWNKHIVLIKEEDQFNIAGKTLRIIGNKLFKIENFLIEKEKESDE